MVTLSSRAPPVAPGRTDLRSVPKRRRSPSRVSRGVRKGERLVLLKGVSRRLRPRRKRPARETLEVRQGRIAPPLRFLLLNGEKRRHLGVAIGVHVRRKPPP